MSWFTRSIANTLNFDDDDEQDAPNPQPNPNNPPEPADSQPLSPGRGVKEDLSELTKTLTRQFWGVASFLAPPPSSDPGHSSGAIDQDQSDPVGIPGIRSDFAEIGGRFRSGISKLSNNMAAVSEITSKMASNFLQLGDDDDEGRDYSDSSARGGGGVVGVNEEVVAFVNDIAMHPETWLDFPLPNDDDDEQEDFDMSDAQQEHALAVERFAPRLAALRMELCPGYMSDACFWKIYFVLLHPRLDRHDAEILSTPEIVEARTMLTHSIKNLAKENTEQDWSSTDTPYSKDVGNLPDEERLSVPSALHSNSVLIETSAIESFTSSPAADFETEKYPVAGSEVQIIDKSVIKEGNVDQNNDQNLHSGATSHVEKSDEDDADDWLKEDTSENVGSSRTTIPIDNDEDVSFSDLEEDEGDVPTHDKKVTYYSDFSTKDSRDWVQLSSRSSADSSKDISSVSIECTGTEQVRSNNTENKESNDWLDLDDIDVA